MDKNRSVAAKIAIAGVVWLLVCLPCAEGGEWEETVRAGKERVTRLHFYMHDQFTGKNATVVQVASAARTKFSDTLFGAVNVMDDLLTEGPHRSSKLVGRARGLYSFSGETQLSLLMAFSVVLQDGQFKGSTVSILGQNEVLREVREMPVVGGSGAFRLARGYALAQTHSFHAPDAVIEYHVTVLHH